MLKGKTHPKINSSAHETYEYGYLDNWYAKSDIDEVFIFELNFQKNKLVMGKTPLFVISPFCTPCSIFS